MPKKEPKRPRGRPVKYPMPERIDDSPERIAQAILRNPPPKDWLYMDGRERQ